MSPQSLFVGAALGSGLWLLMSAIVSLRTPLTAEHTLSPPPGSPLAQEHLPGLTALLDEAGIEKVDARVLLAGGVLGGLLSGLLVVVLIPIPTLGGHRSLRGSPGGIFLPEASQSPTGHQASASVARGY